MPVTEPTKKPLPWFPFNIKAYVTDTMRLTTEAHGAYLLLMLDYYSTAEAPPDDDDILAAICKLTPEAWAKHRKVLLPYFKIENGRWMHERIETEMLEACSRHAAASAKAQAAADKRWGKNRPKDAPSNAPSTPQAPKPARVRPSRAKSNASSMPVALPEQSLVNPQEQEHPPIRTGGESAPPKAVEEVQEVGQPVRIEDTQIAPDYRPRAALIEACMLECGDMAVIEHELKMFIAHMQERGAFSANWDASFTKWWGRWRKDREREVAAQAKAAPRINVNKQPDPADFEQAVMRWKGNQSSWSSRHYGPEPGMTGCKCPPEILTRHGIDPATGRKLEKV